MLETAIELFLNKTEFGNLYMSVELRPLLTTLDAFRTNILIYIHYHRIFLSSLKLPPGEHERDSYVFSEVAGVFRHQLAVTVKKTHDFLGIAMV